MSFESLVRLAGTPTFVLFSSRLRGDVPSSPRLRFLLFSVMSCFRFPRSVSTPRASGPAPFVAVAVTCAALFGWASPARAQAWLADRKNTEGRGIKAGTLELHPGVGAEIGYDSNWLLRSNATAPNLVNGGSNAPRLDAGLLRVTPSLSLRTLGAERMQGQTDLPTVAFDARLSGTYREFLGAENIRNQRNMSVSADAKVMFAPGRPVSFDLLAGYTRAIRPNTGADPAISFNTSSPSVGGDLKINPGRGTFDLAAGYRFTATLFEQKEARGYSMLRHDVNVSENWRFRPRTSLFHTTNLGFVNFMSPDLAATALNNSTPLRTRFGLNGLLFDRFAATAALGYGASFVSNGRESTRQFDSIIGNAELRFYLSGNPEQQLTNYLPAAQSSVALGFERDFQVAFLGNANIVNRGYLSLSAFLAGRVLLSVSGGVSAVGFDPVFLNSGGGTQTQVTNSFTVVRADAQVYGEYRFSNSFALTATGRYTQSISDQLIPYNNFTPPGVFSMAWQRFEAFAGVRWFL